MAEERIHWFGEILDLLECFLEEFFLYILTLIIYIVIDETELLVCELDIVDLRKLGLVFTKELSRWRFVAFLNFSSWFLVLAKSGEADHSILEEVIPEHALEQLKSTLELLIESWVFRVNDDEEAMNESYLPQTRNHVSNVIGVSPFWVPDAWSINNYHRTILTFPQPIRN